MVELVRLRVYKFGAFYSLYSFFEMCCCKNWSPCSHIAAGVRELYPMSQPEKRIPVGLALQCASLGLLQ